MTQLFSDNGLTTKVCDTACCNKFQAARSAVSGWSQPGNNLIVFTSQERGSGEGGRVGCLRKLWDWLPLQFFVGDSVTKEEELQALKHFFSQPTVKRTSQRNSFNDPN